MCLCSAYRDCLCVRAVLPVQTVCVFVQCLYRLSVCSGDCAKSDVNHCCENRQETTSVMSFTTSNLSAGPQGEPQNSHMVTKQLGTKVQPSMCIEMVEFYMLFRNIIIML